MLKIAKEIKLMYYKFTRSVVLKEINLDGKMEKEILNFLNVFSHTIGCAGVRIVYIDTSPYSTII